MTKLKGNFLVNNTDFGTYFNEVIRAKNPYLFPAKLNLGGYNHWANNIKQWSPKYPLDLLTFITIFCVVYQETGGLFQPISEYGSYDYFLSKPYGYKGRGRGYIQVTWDYNYKIVLPQIDASYNYDTLSSEQLDKLFQNDKVAFGSMRVFFSDKRLLKDAFEAISAGKIKEFGTRLNGSQAYGQMLENRVMYLLKNLQSEKITNSIVLRNLKKIYQTLAIGLSVCLIGYVTYKYVQYLKN